MGSIDDLLSQLRAEYEDSDEPKSVTQSPTVPSQPVSPSSPDSSITDLLSQLKEEQSQPQTPKNLPSPSRLTTPVEPSLFQELCSEYREKDRHELEQKQQKIKEKQRLEEQRQQKKRELLRNTAQAWLKQLNPKSDEGRWFEEFSCSYDSKIEAAMHYLEALRESGSDI
jgi:hypothetical protein